MSFNKGAKTKGERIVFQQIVLGKLDIHIQKNESGPLPYIIYKN